MAHHLAQIRTGDAEPAPADLRAALRDVVRHCIHGVDLNPMAVELCKVALWMETLDPGKPLSFLERNLQCGNSVIGVGPGMPIDEIPDEAFQSVAGDDAATAAALRKRNKREREGQFSLWQVTELNTLEDLARWRATQMAHLETLPEDEVQQLQMKEETYRKYLESKEYQEGRLIYDLWTAAFFWPIPKGDAEMMLAPTHQALVKVRAGQRLDAELVRRVQNLAAYHRFFHWEAAFPEIYDHEGGGFDVVLGNPPWERTAFEDLQFFTTRSSEITKAATTAIRKRMIANLERNNSALFAEYEAAKQAADREGQFFKTSNRYTLGASGRLNTYALFADLSLMIVSQFGKIGIIVQTGIATDAPMESFWGYLVESRRLVSIVDFENRKSIFPGVHQEQKFCLLCVNGKSLLPESTVRAGFWLQDVSQLSDPNRVYMLPLDALVEINPNTQQPPVCHNRFDFDLVHRIQRANATMTPNYESQYYAKAWRALITAGSSQHFKTFTQISDGDMQDNGVILHAGETFIPLIEGKLIHQHDWAYATFHSVNQEDIARGNPRLLSVEERGPFLCPFPRYWAHESIVEKMYRDKGWEHNWIIGVRDVTNVNNERTAIACILPRFGLLQPLNGIMCKDAEDALFIVGVINSFALDYVSRQKIPGRHLNITIFSQLPIPPNPRSYSLY